MNKKPLVLGLGNPILGDDGIGLVLVRGMKDAFNGRDVAVEETGYFGINLLDYLQEYDPVFIIDSLFTDDSGRFGEMEIREYEPGREVSPTLNAHRVDVPSLMTLAGSLEGSDVPRVYLFGININRIQNFSEEISPELERKVPEYRARIVEEVKKKLSN